ncbi:MAG: hypothetical protein IJ449_13990 [Clostridia bacterium]|nr:hypothetical protein [Clostridia bacterium]
MNRADFSSLLDEVMREFTEEGGTFMDTFGRKTEKELSELRIVAAAALMAADRYYSRLTKTEFEIRQAEEIHTPKTEEDPPC